MADVTAPTYNATPSIQDVYAPIQQDLASQTQALANRYAQNKADITSITGVLSTIAPADKTKINQQFAASIQQQQEALASRTAEARKANTAGQAAAATAGSELGSGGMPAPTASATSLAAEAGIADSNAIGTNWGGLMGAMQQQQLSNVDAAQKGYGFEVANALQQLNRNYNQQLTGLDSQKAQLASQIAQSQLGANATAAEMAQENALAQYKGNNAIDVAGIAAKARMTAAQIAANARTSAAAIRRSSSGSSNSIPKVAVNSPATWEKAIRSANTNLVPGSNGVGAGLTLVKRSVAAIAADLQATNDAAAKAKNPMATTGGKAPTADQVYKAWAAANATLPTSAKDQVYKAIKAGYYKTW